MLSSRVANIVPVDNIDQVTRAVNAYTQHRHFSRIPQTPTAGYPSIVRGAAADQLATRAALPSPCPRRHRAIRRMCKWIVEEECDPEVVIPLCAWASAAIPT